MDGDEPSTNTCQRSPCQKNVTLRVSCGEMAARPGTLAFILARIRWRARYSLACPLLWRACYSLFCLPDDADVVLHALLELQLSGCFVLRLRFVRLEQQRDFL